MILNDYHLHSSFSGDCNFAMELMIEEAILKKVDNLCFTEHHDLDFPPCDLNFELNVEEYISHLKKMQEKYKDKINIRLGIELGIQDHLYEPLTHLVQSNPFDFVLCSSHLANGMDPYDPNYYLNKTKKQAYDEYFESILNHVKSFNAFDSYGHLDYVARYGPYDDKTYLYENHKDILDEVLKTIIEKGKGIELNASGFTRFKGNPHPRIDVIKRYKALGGEIITVGSDAHQPKNLMQHFDLAQQVLTTAGFKYYTIFINREAQFKRL